MTPPTRTPQPNLMETTNAMSQALLFSLGRQYLDVPFEQAQYWQPQPQSPAYADLHFARVEQVGQIDPSAAWSVWQTAMAACYNPQQYSLLFGVTGDGQQRHIYLGIGSRRPDASAALFLESLINFVQGNWPGTKLRRCTKQEIDHAVRHPLGNALNHPVSLTGIPSSWAENSYPDTLTRFLHGLPRKPFAYLVIAHPLPSGAVERMIYNCRELLGHVHSLTRTTLTETITHGQARTEMSRQQQQTTQRTVDRQREYSHSEKKFGVEVENPLAQAMVWLSSVFPAAGFVASFAEALPLNFETGFSNVNESASANIRWQQSQTVEEQGQSTTLSQSQAEAWQREYINVHAQAAESHLQQYLHRFEQARTRGCWNVGLYFIGENIEVATQGASQLRALLTGPQTWLEPLRLHRLHLMWRGGVEVALSRWHHPPFAIAQPSTERLIQHPLGSQFNRLSTPMRTEEVNLLTHFPLTFSQ